MNFKDKIFRNLIKLVSIISLSIIALIVSFIFKESLELFKVQSFYEFIFGLQWKPLSNNPKLGILPIILSTVYISVLALIIALPVSIGAALFISFSLNENKKKIVKSFIAILAGIPSVVYGFVGLLVVVKFMETHLNMASGESLLAGAIVLAVMITPYIIDSAEETFSKVYERYGKASEILGVSKEYMIKNLILPVARKSLLSGSILALGRAMGETMAVMMVIGNSPIMPKLLGKTQTIPALIALEMGSAEIGSKHYYGLYGAGLVLMIILIIINIVFQKIKGSID